MTGFPDHVIDAAFGPDALAATHRRAEQPREQPRWLAGLIARHGQPTTYQPGPITLGASRFQTWAWVGFGVQVEQTLSTWTVSAHRRGHLAKLAGLERYPTDAEISGVVALAGLDDAPTPVPGSSGAGESQASEPAPAERLAATEPESAWLRKRMPSLLIDKGMQAYEEAVAANRSSRDPYLATRAGVHAAMWEAHVAAQAGEPAAPKLATGGIVRPVVSDDAPGRAS